MAYQSDESGQDQVYVQAIPAIYAKHQISATGGTMPRWSHDGKKLVLSFAGPEDDDGANQDPLDSPGGCAPGFISPSRRVERVPGLPRWKAFSGQRSVRQRGNGTYNADHGYNQLAG